MAPCKSSAQLSLSNLHSKYKHKLNTLLAIFLLLLLPTISSGEVFVSPILGADVVQQYYEVSPGQSVIVKLPGKGSPKDSYKITISATNEIYKDITAYLVDEENLRLFQQGYSYQGNGYQRATAPFVIQGSSQTQGSQYLILDNSYAGFISKKLYVDIEASFQLEPIAQRKLMSSFSGLYAKLKQNLTFPSFNIHVKPCGHVNAYSESFGTGDIHYCTEMITNLFRANNEGAFYFVFYHEAGHSLLGLWGIPGNNNEDIADEFATYILMSGGQVGLAMIDRSLEFWKNKDSAAEARGMLENGDRHSLSVQRIRNIQENVRNGIPFMNRWNQLLYPHSTTEFLERVVRNPKPGDNAKLAKNILAQRYKSVASDSLPDASTRGFLSN
ncbi:MAG: DUF4344 domain-containing metallopeptidase [Gallionella sp.]